MRTVVSQGRWRRACVALVLAAPLAACAGAPEGADEGGSGPDPPAASGTAPSDPASVSPAPLPPVAPSPPPRSGPGPTEQALTGEVFAGVTAGCTLLATEHGDYLLIGELARELRVGDTVTVRGEVRTDVRTICQQGTPFEVTEVLD